MEIYENILETLGNTPLVKLGRFHPGPGVVAAKVEAKNPGGAVKDRIDPEGVLNPGVLVP